ncbi:hypothetical protein quinque_010905 [Culex quinquefasciatus]
MCCKNRRPFQLFPPKYKWTKAYLLRPIDNIISHPDALRKRPFKPSYELQGAPYLPCLLRYDYLRIWQQEHQRFQCWKASQVRPPKKKFSPYRRCPIRGTYCGGKCSEQPPKPRFILKQFRCIPAKVDHCGIDLKARRRCQEMMCAANAAACNNGSGQACCSVDPMMYSEVPCG